MANFNKMFMAALTVAIAAQVNITLFTIGFKVSVGIILFPILIFMLKELNTIWTGIFAAVMVYLTRIIFYTLGSGTYSKVLWAYFPEIFFYAFYGVFFELLSRKSPKDNLHKLFFTLIICDFGSNIIEILVRFGDQFFASAFRIIPVLLIVAFIRSGIVWMTLIALKYYKLLILKKEHEERYLKLLWMTSRLRTEMFWMKKNMDNIEKIMSNAYKLFEKISQGHEEQSWADLSLTIAKDVHEIKKEYGLIFRGLEEIIDNRLKDPGMHFKDIIIILSESMENEAKFRDLAIDFDFRLGKDFYTTRHYYLMSIFRNLIMNAMDSIDSLSGKQKISFVQEEYQEEFKFSIEDTGAGIKNEHLDFIFSPGFSTKIDYSTGQINRGLGLSLVKDIVEEYLGGRINVASKEGQGSIFTIFIPKKAIEVTG